LDQARTFLREWGIGTEPFEFQKGTANTQVIYAIRTHARLKVELIRQLIAWPSRAPLSWALGFLAGIFDAEGSYSDGGIRISNTDGEIISWVGRCLQTLNFRFVIEHVPRVHTKPIDVVRITGGLREDLRFFHTTDSAITRKRSIVGHAVKSPARLRVVDI
jgi:hypothetical protein